MKLYKKIESYFKIIESYFKTIWYISILNTIGFIITSCMMIWVMVAVWLSENAPDSLALKMIPYYIDFFNISLIVLMIGVTSGIFIGRGFFEK